MMPTTALILIDCQVAVLRRCVHAANVIDRLASLVERARSEGAPVVWVQHESAAMPRGSDGWQLAPALLPEAGETIVHKRYRDAFAGTELTAELRREGVRRLVIAGARSDFCVGTTVQRAVAEGYEVVLVADAHTTTDADFDGVNVSGPQIIALTNMYLSGLEGPGGRANIANHDDVPLVAVG